jgi:hypothetical protein
MGPRQRLTLAQLLWALVPGLVVLWLGLLFISR